MAIDLTAMIREAKAQGRGAEQAKARGARLKNAPPITREEAERLARGFVSTELERAPGDFGRFITQALRDRLPLRICGSLKTLDAGGKEDWGPVRLYLSIFNAYAGYFRQKMAEPYRVIPAFPDRTRSYVDELAHTSPADVVQAMAAAMLGDGKILLVAKEPQGSPNRRQSFSGVAPADRRPTVLSMGAGRDSVVIALILANYDDPWLIEHFPKAAREARRYRSDNPALDVVAAFSDTGSEYDFTYQTMNDLIDYLGAGGAGKTRGRAPHPLEVVWLKKPPLTARQMMEAVRGQELTPASEDSPQILANQWWSHAVPNETAAEAAARGKYHLRPKLVTEHLLSGTMTARDNASCTSNQKIEVLNRYVQDLFVERFGHLVPDQGAWRQGGRQHDKTPWARAIERGEVGRTRRLIGIHAGEIGRTDLRKGGRWPATIQLNGLCEWPHTGENRHRYTTRPGYRGACYQDQTNEYHYPLVDWRIDEPEEDQILAHYGWGCVKKSGCSHCHWMDKSWFWATMKKYREAYEESVAVEIGVYLHRLSKIERVMPEIVAYMVFGSPISNEALRWIREYAGPRRLEPEDFIRMVYAGEISFARPANLIGTSVLPCQVAWFARREPTARIDAVFAKTYVRGGGAANVVCPDYLEQAPEPPVHIERTTDGFPKFSSAFERATGQRRMAR